MVRAGKAFLGDLRQHATDDAAQRVVDESVVVEAIVHGLSEISRICVDPRTAESQSREIARECTGRKVGGLLLPGAPRTALTSAV